MIVVIHNYYSVIHPYFAFVIELLFILVNVTFFCNAIFDFFFLSLYHLFQLVFLHHLSSSTRFFYLAGFLRSRGSSQYSRYFFVGVVSCTQNHRNYSRSSGSKLWGEVEIPVYLDHLLSFTGRSFGWFWQLDLFLYFCLLIQLSLTSAC